MQFSETINNIIKKIDKNSIINDPFPHMIIDNFLEQEDYKQLLTELKNTNFFIDNNEKINRSTFMICHKKKIYIKNNIFKKYIDILSDINIQNKLINKLNPTRYSNNFKDLWIQADCYRNQFKFPLHCDSTDKFITFILYTPLFNDMDKTLGTRVYNKKKELINIVDYLPNRLLLFPPSSYSWHNMEGQTNVERNSIQGWYLLSNKRKQAINIRRGFNSC